jgi:hypothetical protein
VAPLAHGEIVSSKRALSVMTGYATLTGSVRVMIQRLWRRDLSSLRHSCSYPVAFVTGYLLMPGMIESHSECLR